MKNSPQKLITMYVTSGWQDDVREVFVTRFTDKSVWRPMAEPMTNREGKTRIDRRETRHSRYAHYFETHAEAKSWLVNRAERHVESCKTRLSQARETLSKVMGIKP